MNNSQSNMTLEQQPPPIHQASVPSDHLNSKANQQEVIDLNFEILVDQNFRLEQEIRDMNERFTKRQNERLNVMLNETHKR